MPEESLLLGGIQTLKEIGFFDFFLPFILFFAIVYGALDKTKVFGENRKDINSVIALVISLIASTTGWVLKGVAGFLPWVGFIALVVVAFLMLAAMVYGGEVENLFKSVWVKSLSLLFIVIALGTGLYYGLGLNEKVGGIKISETDAALLIMLVIFFIAFAVIVKGGGSSSGE
ncbi:MAG: hypothetical protein J7K22_02585, partial [Nanoarchaeota archaeon]|nr:hypothetical protein [Nanoarchaeota archaeon]